MSAKPITFWRKVPTEENFHKIGHFLLIVFQRNLSQKFPRISGKISWFFSWIYFWKSYVIWHFFRDCLQLWSAGIHIQSGFSPTCQLSKYARWHTCPGKILLDHSIGKNVNRTACKWEGSFLLLSVSPVHHVCSCCYWGTCINEHQGLFDLHEGWKEHCALFLLIFGLFFWSINIGGGSRGRAWALLILGQKKEKTTKLPPLAQGLDLSLNIKY